MPFLKSDLKKDKKKTVAFILDTLSFIWKARTENGQEVIFKDINGG